MIAVIEDWEQGYVYILCVLGRGVTLLQVVNQLIHGSRITHPLIMAKISSLAR